MNDRAPINVHEAKTHLSRLLEEVENGGEITLSRAGKPIARLVPIERPAPARKPGFLKGRISCARDFDAPLAGVELEAFEGK